MEEFVIKVPAPFMGVGDLGFSARYPAQAWNERLRDVTVIVEGAAAPMTRLVDTLSLFADKDRLLEGDADADEEAYSWTSPIRLTDEVCVMAFRDRSLGGTPDGTDASRAYIWNLVRPLAFTFLRDCVRIGHLRLEERIDVVLDAGRPPVVDLAVERTSITPVNGSRLLLAS